MKTRQAVILAAGNGVRLWPLTVTRPKPFLPVLGRSILERKIDMLSDFVEEVVLIVGSNKKEIKNALGDRYNGLDIRYVVQEERLGTGHALQCAERILKDRFLVLNGDDIYGQVGIENALKTFPCILAKKVRDISQYGAVLVDKNLVKGLVEKPETEVSQWANIGVYHLPKKVLEQEIGVSKRGEYEITDYIQKLAQIEKVYWARAYDWKPITYPWDLLVANQIFLQGTKFKIRGKVERGAFVKGQVFIGRGALVRSGSYIQGPAFIGQGCDIGPNSYIRPLTVIEKECRIGQAVEIKSSLICEKSRIGHLSYVGDSVIGRECNLGAGTITANLRFDDQNVRTLVKGGMIDTGRAKFGAVLGDKVKTGIHVSLMPGVMIGPATHIAPHSLVERNTGQ